MSRKFAYAIVVAQTALQQSARATEPSLVLEERSSWVHLKLYIHLASHFTRGAHPALSGAARAIGAHAREFGTPAQLRTQVLDEPGMMAHDEPPAMLFGAIVWLLMRMNHAATTILHHQDVLLGKQLGSSERRDILLELGQQANRVLTAIPHMLHSLKVWAERLLTLNAELELAATEAGNELQERQVGLGRMEGRLTMLEKQLAQLGIFSQKKKKELQEEIDGLRRIQPHDTAMAEQLRLQLSAVERVLAQSGWVAPALEELVQWLDALRAAWGEYGSGTMQLAVDASDANLAESDWVASVLALDVGNPMWDALARATHTFTEKAFVDWPLRPAPYGEQG